MSTLQIRPDWPFPVNHSPIFYGWVIWLVSTLGILMSIPGQTMGMGVFTIYDWGNGAAAEAYNRLLDHFGDAFMKQSVR